MPKYEIRSYRNGQVEYFSGYRLHDFRIIPESITFSPAYSQVHYIDNLNFASDILFELGKQSVKLSSETIYRIVEV